MLKLESSSTGVSTTGVQLAVSPSVADSSDTNPGSERVQAKRSAPAVFMCRTDGHPPIIGRARFFLDQGLVYGREGGSFTQRYVMTI